MINVLVVAFNRPDITLQLAQVLLKASPLKLFIAIDGPRSGIGLDLLKCREVKSVFESAPWECDVNYLISKENNGCNNHVEKSINWFFEHVTEGIILEDDCIPNTSFFDFSSELLDRFRYDSRIYMISGMSVVPSENSSESYRFSKTVNIWGWATWRRAWQTLINDTNIWPEIKSRNVMRCYGSEKNQQERLIQKKIDEKCPLTWGMKWRLTCLLNNAYSIIPKRNLIQNVGFNRKDATSKKFPHPVADIKSRVIDFPLIHPKKISVDMSADEKALSFYYDNLTI